MLFSEVVHEAIRLSGIVAAEYEDRSRSTVPGVKFHPVKYRPSILMFRISAA
jgi:hypothetical protein